LRILAENESMTLSVYVRMRHDGVIN